MPDPKIINVYAGGEVRGGSVPANPLGRLRKSDIIGVVIHHTAGTSLTGAMTAGQKEGKQKGTGTQYYIDRDGSIYQYLPDDRVISHIRAPDKKERTDKKKATNKLSNSNTIGIEVVANKSEEFTEAQREAILSLTAYLRQKHPTIKADFIVGHGELQGGKGGNKMPTEGVEVAKLARKDAQGLLPPGSIPSVASEESTSTAPRPFPSHLAHLSPSDRIAVMRTDGQARAKLLESAAMYGAGAAAGVDIPGMTPGEDYAHPTIRGVIGDPRLMELLLPSSPRRADDIGEGPRSWFGPDASLGGVGSPSLINAGAVLAAGAAGQPVRGSVNTGFETVLPADREAAFQEWKARNAPDDSGYDYDLRGAFAAGAEPAENGHWPDTFKKPWHPTFSDESQYAEDMPDLAGHWDGETFIPAPIFRSDPVGTGGGSWGDFARTFNVPLPAPAPLTPQPLPPSARSNAVGAGAGSWGDFTRTFGVPLPAPAPLVAPARAPTPNSRSELSAFVQSVYAGILPLDPGDDAEFNGGAPSTGAAAGLPSRTSTIPASVVGRWAIDTGRAYDVGEFTAPKLTTAIAFSPTLDMARASEVLAGTRYADMGLAIDRFTLPPVAAPSKPVIETPKVDQAALVRRETLEARKDADQMGPAPKPVVKPHTAEDQRAEQAARRLATKTSTSTVAAPKITGAGAAAAVTPAVPVTPVAPAYSAPIQSAPSAKPTYKTVQMDNPAYLEWEKKYGGGTVGGPGYDGIGTGPGSFADFQRDMGVTIPAAPTVPPPPTRYITKKVEVKAPASAAPTPMPSSARPPSTPTPAAPSGKSDSTAGGLYTIKKGDTLSGIAQRSGVSVAELARINNIKDPNKIAAGATIKLSGGSSSSAAPASTAKTSTASKTTTTAPAASSSSTITGSSTGRTYEVGKVYVNSQGVAKMAMADGTFKRV